ncbi:uncharacterized protein LOC123525321 isoform X2 [Mercenaria mercenaria]|uniref:uncharacterized protein LOC123525321 isoform X2 n=1 Tax=Mercenaria mercenaria TaxID=6596 RepID=UPI00234E8BC7|nr:uncharacterized protein LOC123525321 isoform X2 [Mercenaria mercenaria]
MATLRTRIGSVKVFLLSGVGDSVRKGLARKIHLLGGKYFDLEDFKAMCTHVVCGRLSRSEKFLGACATGTWVLHPDYVQDSYLAGSWLDEEQYEWCDDHITQKYQVDMSLALAARRWRFLLGDVSAAFTGWKVAVIAGAKKSKVIKRLLISGGAEVFNLRIPVRNPGKVADTIGYIFVSENNMKSVIHLIDYGVLCIKPEFIGDFLIKDPQPDPMDYLVHVDSMEELPSSQAAEPLSQDSFLMDSQRSVYLSPQKAGPSSTSDFTPVSSGPSSPMSVSTPCSSLASDQERSKTSTSVLDQLPAHPVQSQRSFSKETPVSKLVNDITDKVVNVEQPGLSHSNDVKTESPGPDAAAKTVTIDLPHEEFIDLTDSSDETIELISIDPIDTEKTQKLEPAESSNKGKIRKLKRNFVKKSPAWKSLIPGTRTAVQPEVKIEEEVTADKSLNSVRNICPSVKPVSSVKRNLLDSMSAELTVTSTPAKTPITKKRFLQASLNMSPITKFFKRIEPVKKEQDDRMNKSDTICSPASTSSKVTKSTPLNKSEILNQLASTVNKKSSFAEEERNMKRKTAQGDKKGSESSGENSVDQSGNKHIENKVDQTGQKENENKLDQFKNKQQLNKMEKSKNKKNEKGMKTSTLKQNLSVDSKGDRKRKSADTGEVDALISGPSDRKRVTRSTPTKNEENLLIRSPEKSPNIHDFTTILVSPSKRKQTITEKQPGSVQMATTTDMESTSYSGMTVENSCTASGRKRKPDNDSLLTQVLTDIKRRKDVPESVFMPTTATEIFLATLEDGFTFEALEYLGSQVTFKYYPQSRVISELMRNVLLTTEEEIIANMSYNILSRMLMLHPPITASLQEVYLRALAGCKVGEDWQVGAEWNFIKQCFSNILMSDDAIVRRNNRLLFKFILQLLQFNIQHFQSTATSQEDYDTRHILLRIIWSPSYHIVFNKRCGALVDVMSDIILSYQTKHCDTEKKHLMEVLEGLLWMIAMVSECCRVLECANTDTMKSSQAVQTSAFIHEISRKLTDLDVREPVLLEHIFEGLRLPWLRVRVCQQLLHMYDDFLLTEEYLQDAGQLTLLLIVTKYFYLLPRFDVLPRTPGPGCHSPAKTRPKQMNKVHTTPTVTNCLTENTDINKENIDRITLKANKKNHKGETPLHVACIRNDVAAVKKLLKVPGINVNATDNVGWTPLHEASNHGNTECVRELLKFIPSKTMDIFFTNGSTQCKKVDLLAANYEGITPLHDAVLNNKPDVCHILLQHGGPKLLEAQTCFSYTPLDLAETPDMVTLLSSYTRVRRKHSDSQTLTGSQESTGSADNNIPCVPSDVLYQEVIYADGERVYANIKSTTHYIQLVTILIKHYISLRNLHDICRCMSDKLQLHDVNVVHNEQNVHSCRDDQNHNNERPGVRASSTCQNNHSGTGSLIHTEDSFHRTLEKNKSASSYDRWMSRETRDVTTEPTVNSEEVTDIKNDLKVLKKIPHYLSLFRTHLMKICRPEDAQLVKQELQELSFATECLLY